MHICMHALHVFTYLFVYTRTPDSSSQAAKCFSNVERLGLDQVGSDVRVLAQRYDVPGPLLATV